ncbi:dynein axonemal heavy chain 5-like [Parasteatoda tepidariorum]|uniref:dynein axonemal heavy chain 5-like n=1 Tax=Parasteatoda tepidariorum TaxID=114398 RepID=UPI0039BCA4F8
MNFEGRWPFKATGVSWGAMQGLNKAKGKFLNVGGDDYMKNLKKKSKKSVVKTLHLDSRYEYMTSLVCHCSGISKEELTEENDQQNKVDVANSFFTNHKVRRLLYLSVSSFLEAGSRLNPNTVFLHNGEPFTLSGFCALFFKDISNEPLPQNIINCCVSFFTLYATPQYIYGSLYQTFKYVFNPRLRKIWCENTKDAEVALPAAYESLLYSLEALGDAFKVAHLGVTRGLTLRESEAALAEVLDCEDTGPSQDSTKEVENLIKIWKDQIEQLLTKSSYLRKESELHGPRTELEYWKCRRDSFGYLVYQFRQENNKKILRKALESSSDLRTAWDVLENRVRNSWREAKECTAFLECLEKYCQPLYSCCPDMIAKCLPGLIRTLFTINTVSHYYNSTERMTAVLTKITNQMINSCKRYLSCNGTRKVWNQQEEIIKKKMTACIHLNEEYQSCFQRIKEDVESPQSREFQFCEVFVFGKFEAFCNRLKKILKLFEIVQVHDSIIGYQQDVLDELPYSLEDSMNKMKGKDYDFLDNQDLHFDEDYADVMKVSDEILKSVTSAFDEEFNSTKSTILSLKFLEKLESLNLPGAKLNDKYFHVMKEYRRELKDIKALFRKQKQEPPIPRNFSPVAGKINWCRQLRNRIEKPLKTLKERCQVLDSDLGKKIQQKYKLLHASLMKYETDCYKQWYQEAGIMGHCLLVNLLEEDLDTQEMIINKNEQLFVFIREADLLSQMDLEVPPVAKTALHQHQKLKQHKSYLEKLLIRHKELKTLPREELVPLLDIHLDVLDGILRPGMTTLTWSSLNIDSFIEGYRSGVEHVESLFDRLCKILNHRVDETLSQVADVKLCPAPPENPVILDTFSTILQTSSAEGADFLEKRSHAVEDAVQEVIQVFVKESSFKEEEEICNITFQYKIDTIMKNNYDLRVRLFLKLDDGITTDDQ